MNQNPEQATLKGLQVVIFSIIAAPAFFAVIVYFLNKDLQVEQSDLTDTLKRVLPILIVAGIALSYFMEKKWKSKIEALRVGKEKMQAFTSMTIIKYACLEGPALFSVVCSMLTHDKMYLVVTMALIIVMVMQFPKKEKVRELLKLNPAEEKQILG